MDEIKNFSQLKYEKLKRIGRSSVRLGKKYRLEFIEHNNGIEVTMIEISDHYKSL